MQYYLWVSFPARLHSHRLSKTFASFDLWQSQHELSFWPELFISPFSFADEKILRTSSGIIPSGFQIITAY
jgi:hypothetical protein